MISKFVGTLVAGENYIVGQRKCRNGERRVFSEDDVTYLQRTAAYPTGDGTESIQRFVFEPYEGTHPVGYKFPRVDPNPV